MYDRGFTLVELIVTLGIFAGIFLVTMPSISRLGNTYVSRPPEALSALLVSATRHARNGDNASSWGVYFPYNEVTRLTERVVLFSGDSYALRDPLQDLVYSFDDDVAFTRVELSGSTPSIGNDHETVFSALTGETDFYGTILLTVRDTQTSIEVSSSGIISIP